jgi:hypothetical protein
VQLSKPGMMTLFSGAPGINGNVAGEGLERTQRFAWFAVCRDVALPKVIEKVMTSGVIYPSRPVEFGERIGVKQVYALFDALQTDFVGKYATVSVCC